MPVLLRNLDAESNRDYASDNKNRTPMFRILNCVTTPWNTEESVHVMTGSAGLIYITLPPNSMLKRMELRASGTVLVVLHGPIQIRLQKADIFAKKNVHLNWNWHTRQYRPSGRSCAHTTKKIEKAIESIADPVAAIHYRKKVAVSF